MHIQVASYMAMQLAIDFLCFLDSDRNAPLFLNEPVPLPRFLMNPAPDDVFHHKRSSSDPTADYDIAYRRSGYDSAGSSAHGSLTSLGVCVIIVTKQLASYWCNS